MSYIIDSIEEALIENVGGKAASLHKMQSHGLPVPDWFVITPEAYYLSSATTESSKAYPTQAIIKEINQAISKLGLDNTLLAVRSSAVEEDGSQQSFAGQFESYLFVKPVDVPKMVAEVWASGFSSRLIAYRKEHGITGDPQPPAVIVQKMVNAECAGVAFSTNPANGRRSERVIAAVPGLGSALVSGECDADTYIIDQSGSIITRQIAQKRISHRLSSENSGVDIIEIATSKSNVSTLSDPQVTEIASLVRKAAILYGRAQDIEWAYEDNRLYVLQSRPITTINHIADPDGQIVLWDNSNIAESYGGVTTPLTFSFASNAYAEVYRQFCRLMGVHDDIIAEYDHTFKNMLGLIQGRIYYNLLNWYRLLALLPGYKFNRRFMEQMMGVKEELPSYFQSEIAVYNRRERFADIANLLRSIWGLIKSYRKLPADIDTFYIRLKNSLLDSDESLLNMRIDQLTSHYHQLEKQLLRKWDAPLVNDFFAMIFYGILAKLCASWCHDTNGSLQNDLLCDQGGMISAEPAMMVRTMANEASQYPNLVTILCSGENIAAIKEYVGFYTLYNNYLLKFGDRCLGELKLESPTLYDDPMLLLKSVGELAKSLGAKTPQRRSANDNKAVIAENKCLQAIGHNPVRRVLFKYVLKHARLRVKDRENLRFERTRVFGRVRRIFVEIGKRLCEYDMLEHYRDVFYLTVDEVMSLVDGTSVTTDLKSIIRARISEFNKYATLPPPEGRFETKGIVYTGNRYHKDKSINQDHTGNTKKGIACCPGIISGPVRLIRDPRNAVIKPGEILVAERTDPGWIMLFASAKGLLVEYGSLLSHSAIVSREMGIPSIVSLSGVTNWLSDGDIVEMDGAAGIVRKLSQSTNNEEIYAK